LVISAGQKDSGELAMSAGRGLERDRLHAGDFKQAILQQLDNFERSLRKRFGLIRMSLGNAFEARDKFVHARVVLHRATAQRIHTEIDRVIPGGEAREVANDLNLAQLGQRRLVDACGVAKQRDRVGLGNIKRSQLVALLAGSRFLKAQGLVLREVRRNFAGCAGEYHFSYLATAATGAFASTAAAASICSFVVNSVAHHRLVLPSSGYHFLSGNPPIIFFSSRRALSCFGGSSVCKTNS